MRTILLASVCVAISGIALASSNDEHRERILEHVVSPSPKGPIPLCVSNTCCNVTASESCPLTSMPKDSYTLVLPGGSSRCIYSYSTPFAFQVFPGDSDKLLFYFQGGGACWDEESTKGGFCTTDCSPQSPIGIFDRTSLSNNFKDYTIVHALYCSGDVWGGNVVRPYNDKDGVPVTQTGLANGQAVLDWVSQQQKSGALSSTLSELAVMGCSAGSIGAQLWGSNVLNTLNWERAAVIPDSWAGVFPPGTQGPLIYSYGLCTASFLTSSLYESCINSELTLQQIVLDGASNHPNVPFSFIQSKLDIVQQSFYTAIALTTNSTPAVLAPADFYADVTDIFGMYNKQLPNFVTYLIDGAQHCYSPFQLYYTADPISAEDDGANSSGPLLYKWVNQEPLAAGGTISTVCDGPSSPNGRVRGDDNSNVTFCPPTIVPKTYTQV